MTENKVILYYVSNTVTINGDNYPLGTETLTMISALDRNNMSYKSSARKTKVIKANETTHIKCLASGNCPEGDFLINRFNQYSASPDYGIHLGVIYIGPKRKHMLQVTNMTDSPIN